jgi:hypothetical protein
MASMHLLTELMTVAQDLVQEGRKAREPSNLLVVFAPIVIGMASYPLGCG